MEFDFTPQWVVALTITSYWSCVFLMSMRSWIKFRVPSGSMPKTKLERKMWLIWVPTIAAWIALSWDSVGQEHRSVVPVLFQWLFASGMVFAFLLTVNCWIKMGRNWSMAVRPDKKTELITDGMFAVVRHPIYALSLTLMVCSAVVVMSWGILIVAVLHCSLLIIKAANEERYLSGIHGQQYSDYLRKTNRFIPLKYFLARSGLC